MSHAGASGGSIAGFAALVRCVHSLERSIDFYVRGLGFAVQAPSDRSGPDGDADVVLCLGDERIVLRLMPGTAAAVPQVPGPDVRFQHVAIVTCDMAAAYQRLQALAPEAITIGGPQKLPAASGGATAFKFWDPDGHPLELIAFSHAPHRWRQRTSKALTLGIDHSAISVAQVEQSIAFYGHLGFAVGSRQVNRGPEQSRLDGLGDWADVEVEVVALNSSRTECFHIELLAYRQPAAIRMGAGGAQNAVSGFEDRLVWLGTPATTDCADPDGHLFDVTT